MRVTHELTMRATCPADGKPDAYALTVTATRTIPVEDILAAVAALRAEKAYQEELTDRLARQLGCEVTTIGWHSGVKTTVACGGNA